MDDLVAVQIEVIQGDITRIAVDAIVNAANTTLLGGGGVDGAIHRAAGHELVEECRTLGSCPTGQARITGAYKLPARYVIHTVGPVWHGGTHHEPALLAACYRSALALAVKNRARTLAFPSISTGAYGFPIAQAAPIAVTETRRFLSEHPGALDRVVFVCFSEDDAEVYRREVAR